MICCIDDCNMDSYKRLMCNMHYIRVRKYGDSNANHKVTHGLKSSNPKLYKVWASMRSRCTSPTNHAYLHYGGRGITINSEWDDFKTFYEWAKQSGYKSGLSLDRIDNNGNYSASNCQWRTSKQQNNNTRANIYITINGRTQTLSQWSEEYGIHYPTVYSRVKRGWNVLRAFEKPVAHKGGYQNS